MVTKSASVFALDVACANRNAIEQGCELCIRSTLDIMVHTPHDELGLVFAGTKETLNPLFRSGDTRRWYEHIIVKHDIMQPTTVATLRPLLDLSRQLNSGDLSSHETCDMLETIAICAHLLSARKGGALTIYFITDAKDEVARKEEVYSILKLLQKENIALVVIAVDFSKDMGNVEAEWDGLRAKAQNECVLRFLCASLGGRSMVVSLEDAIQNLKEGVHRNTMPQRPFLKVVLTVGDIRIATQMFCKTRDAKPSALKRVTQAGEAISRSFEYRRADNLVAIEDCVKFIRYGQNCIPITEADLEAMKIRGMRSLVALAFVPLDDIPPYILMGGVKVVLALAGDYVGQKGFSALVRAMVESRKAMIVRFVRMRDAHPVLGVCIGSSNAKRDALFLGKLPFADDVSLYQFPKHEEVVCSADEEQLVAALVDEMTVGREVLRPNNTFNPFLQQYYEYLRAALKADASGAKQKFSINEMPALLQSLRRTSTAFASPGNTLQPMLQRVKEKLELCSKAFPYVETDKPIDIKNLNGS
ncbi:unnamed protein product [Phytomonas sp. EM1]|nr:unnamed protein product [Phytomonas sp. EM1]|eukprot:CCW61757.1 unnamed protein product [Phytomonas sp. isolate EM1]